MNAQPAGWYPDPSDSSQWRYWNGSAWTENRSPRAHAPAPVAVAQYSPASSGPTGRWYLVITIASIGLLAAVPFFHAASRLDRPQLRKVGAGMAAGGLLGFALVGSAPTDATDTPTGWMSNVGVVILLGVMLWATLLLIGLRREVYQTSVPVASPDGNQGAMSNIERARQKRNAARTLAAKDPMMARELGIGRPESTQGYDDGGLLELNFATADQLSAVCGLPHEVAEGVVASRASLGRFLQVEDAIVFGQISEDYTPMIRDRGIVIADR